MIRRFCYKLSSKQRRIRSRISVIWIDVLS